MTKKQKKHYLDNQGVRCPFCKSSQIFGDSIGCEEGIGQGFVECHNCKKQWSDIYRLVDVIEHFTVQGLEK